MQDLQFSKTHIILIDMKLQLIAGLLHAAVRDAVVEVHNEAESHPHSEPNEGQYA